MSTHQGWFEEFQILGLVYFLQTHHVWLELQNLGDRQRPIDRIGYSVEQKKNSITRQTRSLCFRSRDEILGVRVT